MRLGAPKVVKGRRAGWFVSASVEWARVEGWRTRRAKEWRCEVMLGGGAGGR